MSEVVRVVRAMVSWLAFVGLAYWMVLDPEKITPPAILFSLVFFVFAFSMPIQRGAGDDD